MSNHYKQAIYLWPSEEQLLLLKAGMLDGDEAVTAFQSWSKHIDLDAYFNYETFRLLPLVYANQLRLGVTHPLMGRLKGVYRKAWSENQQRFYKMRPTLALLKEGGVDLLMLKGVPMALNYYRNLALRPMSDFDVAVRPEQLSLALSLLKKEGWPFHRTPNDDDLRYFHSLSCVNVEQMELDLHYHILIEKPCADSDLFFWSSAQRLDYQGLETLQLSPTAQLMHTILHGIRWNVETPVRWIPDALMIIRERGNEIDWEQLITFAETQHILFRLNLGLNYLMQHFGLVLPNTVITRLQNYHPDLRERVLSWSILTNLSTSERKYYTRIKIFFLLFIRYCCITNAKNPYQFIVNYSHYLRCVLQLSSRRDIFLRLLQAFRRMLRNPK